MTIQVNTRLFDLEERKTPTPKKGWIIHSFRPSTFVHMILKFLIQLCFCSIMKILKWNVQWKVWSWGICLRLAPFWTATFICLIYCNEKNRGKNSCTPHQFCTQHEGKMKWLIAYFWPGQPALPSNTLPIRKFKQYGNGQNLLVHKSQVVPCERLEARASTCVKSPIPMVRDYGPIKLEISDYWGPLHGKWSGSSYLSGMPII